MGLKRGTCLRREFDGIRHQPHGGTRRIDVFLLRDVLLQDVVLQACRRPRPSHALLLGDHQVHRPDDRRRRVDGHRNGDVAQRDPVEQRFHVGQRGNRHAALAHFAERTRDDRNRSPSAWADRRRPTARSGPAPANNDSGRWFPRPWRSRRTGAWSRACRDTCRGGCRACRETRPVFFGKFQCNAGSPTETNAPAARG